MQQISQLLKKMFQKIYNPFRPDFYCPSNGSNPLFSMIPQRQGASGKSAPVKARGGQGIIHAQKRPQGRRQDKSYTEACKKDFLLFFTSVQKKRPFCFNQSGRESRTADPVFPSCNPKSRSREASWLAIPLDRDLSKELPAFLIFIIHQ
jgi:hypothetical protein